MNMSDNPNITWIARFPEELKPYPQWIHVSGDKKPYDFTTGKYMYGWQNTTSQLDFNTAMVQKGDKGMGFVFMDHDPFVLIDLDNPDKIRKQALDRGLSAERAEEYKAQAIRVHNHVMGCFKGAYIERSQSGAGWHIIVRGTLPENAKRVTLCKDAFGIEIYRCGQYAWLTGRTVQKEYNLDGHQLALDSMVQYLWSCTGKNVDTDGASATDKTTDLGRRLDLTDEQVIEEICKYPMNKAVYEGGTGWVNDWSGNTTNLIGELDKVTGDPDQVYRILFKSPRMKNPPLSDNGEDRVARTERRFNIELGRNRNDPRQSKLLEKREAIAAVMPVAKGIDWSNDTIAAQVERGDLHTLDSLLERASALNKVVHGIADVQPLIEDAASIFLKEGPRLQLIQEIVEKRIPGCGKAAIMSLYKQAIADQRNERKKHATDWHDGLMENMFGGYLGNEVNVLTSLTGSELAGILAYDQFSLNVLVVNRPPWEPEPADPDEAYTKRPVLNEDYTLFTAWIQSQGIPCRAQDVVKCLAVVAKQNQIHVIRDYLEGLEWDGGSRVETWLTRYLGAADTPYRRNIGRWWMIGAVARIMEPGCQFDNMLILEGPQGAKKSTVWRILGSPAYFIEFQGDMSNKDTLQLMQGKWIFEFAEFSSFGKKDTAAAKAFVTTQRDKFRAPYAYVPEEHPRQTAFCASVNDDHYLQDNTGARRFWSCRVGAIDVATLRADRDQLWAEAVALYLKDPKWWEEKGVDDEFISQASDEAEERFDVDPWEAMIDEYTKYLGVYDQDRRRYSSSSVPRPEQLHMVRVNEVLHECLGYTPDKISKRESNRVSAILKRLGYEVRNIKQVRTYVKKDDSL